MSSSVMAAPPLPTTAPLSSSFSSSSPSSSSPLVLKVRFVSSGDCRRFPLPVSPPLSFPALLSCVSSLFSLPVGRIQLQWRDEECDMVTVASEEEWQRLQRDARDRQQRVLQLAVVDDGQTAQQQQSNKQQSIAENVLDATTAPPSPWQRDVQSILDQQSKTGAGSSLCPALARPPEANEDEEEKDTIHERRSSPPPAPHQLTGPSQSTVSSPPAVSSDDESPVLIDGLNLPSASDSHAASALWKRHKYKAQQSLIQRRSSQSNTQLSRPIVPTAAPIPPTLSLSTARSTATSKSIRRPQPQLTVPVASSSSLPSSPLSRSPPLSLPSSSPPHHSLSQHLERARLQLKQLLPASLTSSSSPSSPPGSRSSSKLTASIASEKEQSERVALAYDLLASFIVDGSREEDELVSRDEILSRCIALFVYNEKYLNDKKARNDCLAALLGSVEMNRRSEEEEEADKRRQLLNEAQRHGLRSLSSSVPISASCSPALVTVMAIIHRHLRARVVTDVPATLELFGAVLADLTAQVQREENREVVLKHMQQSKLAETQEVKESMPQPLVGSQFDIPSDGQLLAALSRLPAPLRDSVHSLLTECIHYAEAAVEANAGMTFCSVSSHSFAATLHSFRTDLQDVVGDELLQQQNSRVNQQAAVIEQPQQHDEHDGLPEAKQDGVQYSSSHQPQQLHAPVLSASQQFDQPALFDVGRGDVMLSDRKIMKAVAKAIKKEQREQRKEKKAEKKARRRASKGKSTVSATLQQPVDDEEQELHELLNQMNNTRQQPLPTTIVGGDALAASVDGWQLYPQPFPSTVSSVADASSPFAFQPFPYTLSSKQQQQQQTQTARAEQQQHAPAAVVKPHLAVNQQPAPTASQATLHSDPAHFPSLPFAVAVPGSAVVSTSAVLSPPLSLPVSSAPPPPSFASVVSSHPSPVTPSSSAAPSESRRQQSLLQSLHVMGFTDDSLNTWLLQRNGFDLNQTVEWLIVQSEVGLD